MLYSGLLPCLFLVCGKLNESQVVMLYSGCTVAEVVMLYSGCFF